MSSSPEGFMDLVRRILQLHDFRIMQFSAPDFGFDYRAQQGQESWAIEVKFYRTHRAQPTLIETAASRLNARSVKAQIQKAMLVVSCYLPLPLREQLEQRFNITFIDSVDLANWASRDLALLGELQSLLEIPPDDLTLGRRAVFRPELREVPVSEGPAQEDTRGTDLCHELRALQRGKGQWPQYEDLCERILRYLFPSDLYGWHKQRRTDDGLNRYDFICRIKNTTEFWQFITQHINSRYIVFEFKNYTGKIKQGQILTTEKYLLEKALRRVALIFSRAGADKAAVTMTQGAMREHGKLMIVLDDDRVCQMLHMKEHGDDPTDCLFDLTDEFLMALPR